MMRVPMPQALKLKEKVDGGERLSEYDIQFLKPALSEGGEARRLAGKYPKYQRVTALYGEILRKGADHQQAGTAAGNRRRILTDRLRRLAWLSSRFGSCSITPLNTNTAYRRSTSTTSSRCAQSWRPQTRPIAR